MKALRRLIGVMAISAIMILGIATTGTAAPPNEPGTVRTVAQANAVEQQTIRDAIREDREGYQQRLALIAKAEALNEYLEAFPEYGVEKQQRLIAASMGTAALAALIELTDSGAITIVSSTAIDGSPRAEFIINEAPGAAVQTGEMQTMALPQCPSAWAALYAWFATEAAYCGALGFFGPWAALGCAAAFAVAGTAIDFNGGC